MSKYEEYQEALNKMCNRCFGDEPRKILQELIDQTKVSTLEEVKREWEALGWKWKIYQDNLYIQSKKMNTEIIIYLNLKIYNISRLHKPFYQSMDVESHQLLTKTFRVLGWI